MSLRPGVSAASILVCIVAICAVYWVVHYVYHASTQVSVKSTVDGREYRVRDLPDKVDAANLLARLRRKLDELTRRLRRQYPSARAPGAAPVYRLLNKFSADRIREVDDGSKYTSYSINKGEQIVFCIRSRDGKNTLVALNTIMFVALHELAHVMTVSVGHTDEFWENFRFLLAHAIHWKLYKPVNFRRNPQSYCWTNITDSPLNLQDMPKYVGHMTSAADEGGAGAEPRTMSARS